MKRRHLLRGLYLTAIAVLSSMLGACGAIYEETDCVASANVFTFTYDMNLKWADAFDSSVKSVHVLMFDTDGVLRHKWRVAKQDLDGGNSLKVEVEPGIYDVLTWAGDYHLSSVVNDGEVGIAHLEDYHCRVNRDDDGHIRDDIENFFHCLRRVNLPYASQSNPHRETFNLTKNTNHVRVVLQQLSGEPVDMSGLSVTITDSNGWLNHDNSLRDDEQLTYHPWHITSGTVDIDSRSSLGAMTSELTTSRLIDGTRPMLTVTRTDGTRVLSVPLIDYALLVKGQYNNDIDNQEYLDRQDEYNMTFFLDERLKWIATHIIINDWIIVPNEVDVTE